MKEKVPEMLSDKYVKIYVMIQVHKETLYAMCKAEFSSTKGLDLAPI